MQRPWWRRRPALLGLGALAVLLLLYGIGVWLTFDSVPRGTTVAGVAVGGQSSDEARATLTERLSPRQSAPISIVAGTATATIDPATAGLKLDVDATVGKALGGSAWNPVHIVRSIAGGQAVAPVTSADDAALSAAIAALADKFDVPPVDGAISFADGKVTRTEPVNGIVIDRAAAAKAVRDGFLGGGDEPVDVPADVTEPQVDTAELDRAETEFATAAMSGPVTLQADSTTVSLAPAAFGPFLTMAPDTDGTLTPALDAPGLIDAQAAALAPLVKAPKNASFTFVDDKPVVVPGEDGTALDAPTLAKDLLAVLPKTGAERVAAATVSTKEPDLTTEDAEALGINEPISEFTTQYPIAPYRITNIGRAAELINGSLVLPGATWSLNETVGERTEANGFVKGFIIDGGQFREDLGGGVSQVATTTFNAVFFAGLEDVEHKPHSVYIDRYPVGREATVAWGSVDLRFTNDTPYGVLIQAAVTPSTPSSSGVATVSMYSTKYWEITSVTGERHNVTQAEVRRIDSLECHANQGYGGFDIDVVRRFQPVGDNTETRADETMSTTYIPSDTVICTNPNATDG